MNKRSPIAIFLTASAILSSSAINPEISQAGKRDSCTYKERIEARRRGEKCIPGNHEDDGGLKEWTTDQSVDEESVLDEAAKKQQKKAEDEDICIPVGEGENCW